MSEKKDVNINDSFRVISHICMALKFLEQNNYPHFDIRSTNILYFEKEKKWKLGDYCFSRVCDFQKEGFKTLPAEYIAPELFLRKKIEEESKLKQDIYSLGIVMYEVFEMKKAFSQKISTYSNILDFARDIHKKKWPKFLKITRNTFSSEQRIGLTYLIQKCLNDDPLSRPSIEYLLSQMIFIKYNVNNEEQFYARASIINVTTSIHFSKKTFSEDIIFEVFLVSSKKKLLLEYCELGEEEEEMIARGLIFKSEVRELFLGNNQFRGIKLAQGLQYSRCITKLNLSGNKVDEEGSKALAESLKKNKTLTELDLSNNLIPDSGSNHIALMLQVITALKTINLGGNQITDDGAIYLILSINKNSNSVLKEIILKDNNIKDPKFLEERRGKCFVFAKPKTPSLFSFDGNVM